MSDMRLPLISAIEDIFPGVPRAVYRFHFPRDPGKGHGLINGKRPNQCYCADFTDLLLHRGEVLHFHSGLEVPFYF